MTQPVNQASAAAPAQVSGSFQVPKELEIYLRTRNELALPTLNFLERSTRSLGHHVTDEDKVKILAIALRNIGNPSEQIDEDTLRFIEQPNPTIVFQTKRMVKSLDSALKLMSIIPDDQHTNNLVVWATHFFMMNCDDSEKFIEGLEQFPKENLADLLNYLFILNGHFCISKNHNRLFTERSNSAELLEFLSAIRDIPDDKDQVCSLASKLFSYSLIGSSAGKLIRAVSAVHTARRKEIVKLVQQLGDIWTESKCRLMGLLCKVQNDEGQELVTLAKSYSTYNADGDGGRRTDFIRAFLLIPRHLRDNNYRQLVLECSACFNDYEIRAAFYEWMSTLPQDDFLSLLKKINEAKRLLTLCFTQGREKIESQEYVELFRIVSTISEGDLALIIQKAPKDKSTAFYIKYFLLHTIIPQESWSDTANNMERLSKMDCCSEVTSILASIPVLERAELLRVGVSVLLDNDSFNIPALFLDLYKMGKDKKEVVRAHHSIWLMLKWRDHLPSLLKAIHALPDGEREYYCSLIKRFSIDLNIVLFLEAIGPIPKEQVELLTPYINSLQNEDQKRYFVSIMSNLPKDKRLDQIDRALKVSQEEKAPFVDVMVKEAAPEFKLISFLMCSEYSYEGLVNLYHASRPR